MNNDQIIPTESAIKGCLDFTLLSDGKEVDGSVQVVSITVNKQANKVPSAKVVIKDGSAAQQSFDNSNKDTFVPGKMIEIKAGRGGNSSPLFKGITIKQGVKSSEHSGSQLIVECKDESIKMTIGRKNKYYTNKKDSEIIKEVLDGYGLAGEIEETKVTHKKIIQHYSTDWDFILARAEANGLLVIADDGKVNVKCPDDSASPAVNVSHGSTMVEFNAEMDSRSQYGEVEASAWDHATQALTKVTSSSSPLKELGNIAGSALSSTIGLAKFELRHGGQLLKEELKAWADATMLKSRLAKVIGKAKFKGFGAIKPGSTVNLGGIGDRFGGSAFVSGIQQVYENGNWTTNAKVGMGEEEWAPDNVADKPAGRLVPEIHGLQTGTVTGIGGDEDGEFRVQVKVDIIDDQSQGVRARHALLDAGDARGTIWRPEVGDEVIVGFINGDPREAVVLGMLHSSSNAVPPPLEGADPNHYKGIVTRSNMRFIFDDEKVIVTLWTPAGNQLELNEDDQAVTIKDQHGNRIVMDADGIIIESVKDITMTAPDGEISIQAGKNCGISSKSKDVSLTAGGNLSATGTKGSLLNSPKNTVIKGALVDINPPNPPPKKKPKKPKEIPKKTKSESSGLVA